MISPMARTVSAALSVSTRGVAMKAIGRLRFLPQTCLAGPLPGKQSLEAPSQSRYVRAPWTPPNMR